jgi:DNA mismatch endonuclease (patch repair protein)
MALSKNEQMTRESWATSAASRKVMQGNRGRDTAPELAVRRLLHARGLRYRVNVRPISGLARTADIVFVGRRVAVFIDGCFWHGCPQHYRPSLRNAEFWSAKVRDNRNRDADTNRRLSDAGWTVIRSWEHESPSEIAQRVEAVVRQR